MLDIFPAIWSGTDKRAFKNTRLPNYKKIEKPLQKNCSNSCNSNISSTYTANNTEILKFFFPALLCKKTISDSFMGQRQFLCVCYFGNAQIKFQVVCFHSVITCSHKNYLGYSQRYFTCKRQYSLFKQK